MPTPKMYDKLLSEYETLRLAAIRVCVSEHPAQSADPAPELDMLWHLVGDFTDADLAEAKRQASEFKEDK